MVGYAGAKNMLQQQPIKLISSKVPGIGKSLVLLLLGMWLIEMIP
jgi:hypothetical protein